MLFFGHGTPEAGFEPAIPCGSGSQAITGFKTAALPGYATPAFMTDGPIEHIKRLSSVMLRRRTKLVVANNFWRPPRPADS